MSKLDRLEAQWNRLAKVFELPPLDPKANKNYVASSGTPQKRIMALMDRLGVTPNVPNVSATSISAKTPQSKQISSSPRAPTGAVRGGATTPAVSASIWQRYTNCQTKPPRL